MPAREPKITSDARCPGCDRRQNPGGAGYRPRAVVALSTSAKCPTAQNATAAAARPPTVMAAELTGCCLACAQASVALVRNDWKNRAAHANSVDHTHRPSSTGG